MPTTKDDIRNWLERGKQKGASHMLVVCDTFDWSDYPVFVMPGEDARKRGDENNGPNMTKLMEVYKLDMDWDNQLNAGRSKLLAGASAELALTPVLAKDR